MIVDALKNGITNIGRLGENESRVIRFPVDDIIAEFPNCVFSLLHRRKGDPSAYPVPVTRFIVDGGWLYWTVTSGDVAIEGNGKCQIVASEDGKIRKTDTYLTRVDSALDGSGTPPDPWASWQQDVVNAADRAEAAAEFLKNANAEAVELPAGSQPTANYADGTFTFGLVTGPMGATGPVGATGATGAPGVFTDLIDDTADSSVENRTWSAKKLSEEFSGKYTKPVGGIPASDMAAGVIPDISGKADKSNPTFTGTISKNRKSNSTVGNYSVALGSYQVIASGIGSFATGNATEASGDYSSAGGTRTTASGTNSRAHGEESVASGGRSSAEGMHTTASGTNSHAEGQSATASGMAAHAGGNATTASGYYSSAMGSNTKANHKSQFVFGEYNVEDDSSASASARGNYVEIVGNGEYVNGSATRSNARTLDWEGNEELAGDLTINKGKANEVSVSELYKKPVGGIPLSDLADNTISVSGTTPVITRQAGIRYICGECATLSVAAPASGCIDVLFESGSTATVLTITSAKTGVTDIKWMDGFDPDDLDANTIYEINILDGEFGVVAEWT